MDIGRINGSRLNVYENQKIKKASAPKKMEAQKDRIEISNLGKVLSNFSDLKIDNSKRVSEIKELLKEGKYEISGDDIAKKMFKVRDK